MRKAWEQMILFLFGGFSYYNIELLWRGYSHISMLVCGGCCFLSVGKLASKLKKKVPFVVQMLLGSASITAIEFLTGVIVNLWMHLGVWDYSNVPGNIMGQICPQYSVFWFFLSAPCIKLYNWVEENLYMEQKISFKI